MASGASGSMGPWRNTARKPTGGGRRSSTRSTRAASPTPTATGSATCRHHQPGPLPAALGVDAVWLSPFYPSALADGGYDVDDYRDVDPRARHPGRLRRAGRRRCTPRASRSSSTSSRTTPPTGTPGSRGARLRAGLAGPRPLHLPRRHRARTARSRRATGTRIFGGPAWDAGCRRRPVVPAPVRPGAARPELGQPRGPRGLPRRRCGSGPTAASTASGSTSRTRLAKDLSEPLPPQADLRRRAACRWTAQHPL